MYFQNEEHAVIRSEILIVTFSPCLITGESEDSDCEFIVYVSGHLRAKEVN